MVNNVVIKKVALLLTTLLIANTTWADDYLKDEKTTNFSITPSITYRYDIFKYSIPHSKFTNKKNSELIWKNHIIQPGIKFEIEPKQNQFTFLGQVKYGYILKNQSKSWDYDWWVQKDSAGNIISPLHSKTLSLVKGNVLDLSGAIGYSVNLFKDSLLTFYLGYDYSDYRNKNYGSFQLAYNANYLEHPFNKLVSKYYFETQSPWIGVSLNTPINDKFTIIPTIKFYSFKYIGKGYWVLRADLKQNPSFKDNAKGIGLGFDADFIYEYNDNLDFKINLETKKFKMKTGQDKTFYAADISGPEVVTISKLFDLSLISYSISAGLKYKL